MSKLLRSKSTGKFQGFCTCCNDPYAISHRAIEKRKTQAEIEQELQDMSHEACKQPNGNVGCIACVAYGADEETDRIMTLLEETRWHDLVPKEIVVLNGNPFHSPFLIHSEDCLGCSLISRFKGEK